MPNIYVHLLPDLVAESALAGASVVVMDVLRATTTLTCALAAGAGRVVVCLEVDEARRIAQSLEAERPLLGGERGGVRIEGFDLGNSPAEYTRETVGGRTLVFTTTNGTRAMLRCRQARQVLLGALVNRQAVLRALAGAEQIHLVCAGTRGEITREDALCAGALVAGVIEPAPASWQLNDQARLALAAWQSLAAGGIDAAQLAAALEQTQGGRNLRAEGLEADIPWAAQLDRFDLVPHYRPADSTVSALK
jgi:2-phosphosulfolactate phosphatase